MSIIADNKLSDAPLAPSQSAPTAIRLRGFIGCTLGFTLALLVALFPLRNMSFKAFLALPELFTWVGSWLPMDLHLNANEAASRATTLVCEFLACILLAFLFSLLAYRFLKRQPAEANYRHVHLIIWGVAIFLGLALLSAPIMPSNDLFIYASYGRLVAVYHNNPYFTTFALHPQDPFFLLNDWRNAVSAYGPIWVLISGLLAFPIGDDPTRAVILFRGVALLAYLINILLTTTILRRLGFSARTVAIGTLLFAWNPLILLESVLGAHNDITVMTFVLLGILFLVHAEKAGTLLHWRGYAPTIIAFTFAVLIKFTMLPVVALVWVLIARQALLSQQGSFGKQLGSFCKSALPAGLLIIVVALALYGPYWVGYNITDIMFSFTAPPSAQSSYGSMMFGLVIWIREHGLPPTTSWKYLFLMTFAVHKTWDLINTLTLGGLMLISAIWLWRKPTTSTLLFSLLMVFGGLLIVTFWFHPWYVIWIGALLPLCFPHVRTRLQRALVWAGITFTVSCFGYYLFATGFPPFGVWNVWSCFTTIGPAVTVLIVTFSFARKSAFPLKIETNQ